MIQPQYAQAYTQGTPSCRFGATASYLIIGTLYNQNDMQNALFQKLSYGQSHCNGRVKISPSGAVLGAMYTSRPVFNFGGFECDKKDRFIVAEYGRANEQSQRRAYRKVFDYAACNDDVFDLFVTLTLDKQQVDRYDIEKIYPKLKAFLDHRVQRKGLAYILVPEYHKDGAIHFHGLVNSSAVQLKDSGKRYWKRGAPCYGQKIYNVADWKLGFTTAVMLTGDYDNVCKYITKYVLKQSGGGMIGGRYYYHGGDLKEPLFEYINFTEEPKGEKYKIEEADLTIIYVTELSKCQYEPAGIKSPSFGAD